MAENHVLEIRHLSKSFGKHVVLRDIDFTVDTGNAVAIPRQTGLGHFCTGTGDFTETTQYLTEQEVRDEASRCLSCGGPTGHYRNCWFCLPCEVECPQQALYVNIPYLLR